LSRERLLAQARSVQRSLERFYWLEQGPDVTEFVRTAEGPLRESLLVRAADDAVELALYLPGDDTDQDGLHDAHVQLIEGVSHFVYVAERARVDLPTTALELELQAEVDKFVVLAFDEGELDHSRAWAVHRTLYENVAFLHSEDSEPGQRYRLANELAARMANRLAASSPRSGQRAFLQRFYRSGQADKIRLARAA
jgi:hypothetical protein